MLPIKRIKQTAAVIISAAMAVVFGTAGYYSAKLPDHIVTSAGSSVTFAAYPEIQCSDGSTLSLFGAIPVKSVTVQDTGETALIAGGQPFGIKLLMEGVMVTKLGQIKTRNGGICCPAQDAGIEVGDVIRYADGTAVTSNAQLQAMIAKGEAVQLDIDRDGKDIKAELIPVQSYGSGKYRGGMWVRDSIAGIGTITFVNKETGEFAGLGHPVCDSDTGGIVPVHSGEAVPATITDTRKGERGIPGELHGSFAHGSSYGVITCNDSTGIYGRLTADALEEMSENCPELPLGCRQEVTEGEAFILSTVTGEGVKAYTAAIEKIDLSPDDTRNMVIRITDPELLEITGGIVQGMSGSPIIQNGKLIGAVTHVFVSDPARGYGIFADTMYTR